MALTGLEIYKLLPKTNCKKCGRPTCLAFAMQLAQKKASLDECPDVGEAAKQALGAASAPPIKLVTIGSENSPLRIGEENVLFRHDEKFYHPGGVAVSISDNLSEEKLAAGIEKANTLTFNRVGTEISIDLVALKNESADKDKFAKAAQRLAAGTRLGIVLVSESPEAMGAALEHAAAKKPLVYGANIRNYEPMAKLAKAKGCPVGAYASSLEELADLTEKIKALGVSEIVIDYKGNGVKDMLQGLTKIRRLALKKNFRALGFPTITFMNNSDPYREIIHASTFMAKYAGILVLSSYEPWQVMPLLTVRQNIYTDPQKPVQVQSKLYEVGQVNENSPVLFTTNFSLTYYTVEGEVESSRIPTYILAVDTEGTSVLTAYSGDKLNEKVVGKAMTQTGAQGKVKHKKLIIPGLVAVMSAKLKEETGWDVLVGPKEASGLPSYLKSTWGHAK
ncbi:MAG: acetyl-CoA decarbonylase/synthase complex subunit gamma [Planctomycetota bacterium]|jgi:acetyl-CoA decarbonylase/synthase complex subunit gamma